MSGHHERPQRNRVQRRALDVAQSWRNFTAPEQDGDHDDHTPSFRARIIVAGGPQPEVFEGQTGDGKGHAEMAALSALIEAKGEDAAAALFHAGRIYVEAAGKPCCVHCSTILGFLNVRPLTDGTTKTRRTMLGGGAWGLSMRLKGFLVEQGHLTLQSINDLEASGQAGFDRLGL